MAFNIKKLRFHAEQVLVALDALERAPGRIDQRILDLLSHADDGLTTNAMAFILRRRRSTVRETLNRMEADRQIRRDGYRWKVD